MDRRKALGSELLDVANSLDYYAGVLPNISRDDLSEKMKARAKVIRAKHAQENPVE